jgi:CRISPR-associated endoribonuclease Cas6
MLLGRYQFACRFTDDALLPPYKGSTFRGAFGAALKKVVCAVREKDCTRCLLAGRCVYARVFELAAPSQGQNPRQVAPPHPYVIEPPPSPQTRYTAGDPFDFNLLLFGEFNDYLPYFVYAFEAMGEQGIGSRRAQGLGRYRLEGVTGSGQALYDAERRQLAPQSPTDLSLGPNEEGAGELRLHLLTPLRLKFDNQLQAKLPFHLLTRAMLRRVSALFAAFGEGEPNLDYRGLVARARDIEVISSNLKWCDWKRYSNRQEQTMLMGGMSGEITYHGAIGEYLPLLALARELHLGKQSAFGLGRIDYRWTPEA